MAVYSEQEIMNLSFDGTYLKAGSNSNPQDTVKNSVQEVWNAIYDPTSNVLKIR